VRLALNQYLGKEDDMNKNLSENRAPSNIATEYLERLRKSVGSNRNTEGLGTMDGKHRKRSELRGPGIKEQMLLQQHNERAQWDGSIYRTTATPLNSEGGFQQTCTSIIL